jgi:hypothetical protein
MLQQIMGVFFFVTLAWYADRQWRSCELLRPARALSNWTLRCIRCGRIEQAQVNTDPLKSEALGWTKGELRPPR